MPWFLFFTMGILYLLFALVYREIAFPSTSVSSPSSSCMHLSELQPWSLGMFFINQFAEHYFFSCAFYCRITGPEVTSEDLLNLMCCVWGSCNYLHFPALLHLYFCSSTAASSALWSCMPNEMTCGPAPCCLLPERQGAAERRQAWPLFGICSSAGCYG